MEILEVLRKADCTILELESLMGDIYFGVLLASSFVSHSPLKFSA